MTTGRGFVPPPHSLSPLEDGRMSAAKTIFISAASFPRVAGFCASAGC